MRNKHTHLFGLLISFLFIGLLAACSSGTAAQGTSKPAPTATPKPKTAEEAFQSSASIMAALSTVNVQETMNVITDTSKTSQSAASVATETDNITGNDNLTAHSGVYQEKQDVKSGNTIKDQTLNGLTTENKAYVEDQKGQWYQTTESKITKQTFVSNEDFTQDFNLGIGSSMKDLGFVTKDGQKLHEIKVTLSSKQLTPLLQSAFDAMAAEISSEGIPVTSSDILKATTFSNLSVTLWIDDTTSYLYSYEFSTDFALAMANIPAFSTVPSSEVPTITEKILSTSNYSNFNQPPVKVTAPKTAKAVDDTTFAEEAG